MCKALDCVFSEIRALPVFSGLSDSQISAALVDSSIVTSYHGGALFRTGEDADYFGYVLSGVYKLVHYSVDGEEVIMYFGGKGEALGIMSVMESETKFPFHALAMGTSRFLMIPRKTFLSRWLENPILTNRFQTELQRRIFRSYDEKRIQRLALPRRIAHLLLYLADFKSSQNSHIEIPLTRREIANYVGASVESVIRNMSDWGQRGWIATSEQQIAILNREAIHQVAHGTRDYIKDEFAADKSATSQDVSNANKQRPENSILSLIWQHIL